MTIFFIHILPYEARRVSNICESDMKITSHLELLTITGYLSCSDLYMSSREITMLLDVNLI